MCARPRHARLGGLRCRAPLRRRSNTPRFDSTDYNWHSRSRVPRARRFGALPPGKYPLNLPAALTNTAPAFATSKPSPAFPPRFPQTSKGDALEPDTWSPPDTFVRKTTKFWVHADRAVEVQCAISKHLPVLVFGVPQGQGPCRELDPSALIQSVYFDSDDLNAYHSRLLREHRATVVRSARTRLRWDEQS